MEFPHEGLDFLISVINGFLGMVRQDLDLRYLNRDRGFNSFDALILFFITGYVAYLFICVCQMKSLVKSCGYTPLDDSILVYAGQRTSVLRATSG